MANLRVLATALGAAALIAACGSGSTPTPSPSHTATPSPSASAAPTPTAVAATAPPAPAGCLPDGTPPQSGTVPTGDDEAGPSIAVVGSQQVWVPGHGGHILHSTDGGATWVRQGTGAHQVRQVDMVDSQHGFAVAHDALLGTTDGGACWTALGEPPRPLVEVHMTSARAGWGIEGPASGGSGVGLGGTLVRTGDGGASWTVPPAAPPDAESVCFVDSQHGWLGAGGSVMRSSDGGGTWTAVLYTAKRGQGTIVLECGAPTTVAVLSLSLQGALGNQPYGAHWSQDGTHFRMAFQDMYDGAADSPPPGSAPTAGPQPQNAAAPGSYPGPFSIVDSTVASWSGTTPAASDRPVGVVRTSGGQAGAISHPASPPTGSAVGLAFGDLQHGYLAVAGNGASGFPALTVMATSDGGATWRTVTTD